MAGAADNLMQRRWPAEGVSRVPYWAYSDQGVYEREMDRVFCGSSWAYVGLTCEVPEPGDFRRSSIGDRPVVITRDLDGGINVVENRCAHRGVKFCRQRQGKARRFVCPYHQWTYDLKGNLRSVPFARGVKKQGGMPEDFRNEDHGLRRLAVAERNGVIFASFSDDMEPLEEYLGAMLPWFDRVFDGRGIRLLGYSRQLIPSNWKLMFENIKDPYHASLLHVFLVTFGLFRADNPSKVRLDETGRHAVLVSSKGEQKASDATRDMTNMRENFKLSDLRLLDPVKEYEEATVAMLTLWPNIIIQQQSNTLAMRQLIPKGTDAFEMAWTFFGYQDDDEAMITRRLRQANLMGPAGFVSVDDSEVMKLSQDGIRPSPSAAGVLEMGGRDCDDQDHIVTESTIRGFYKYYRQVMGF